MTMIVFEGADGTGKTTQIKLLAKCLFEKGLPVVTTREPGGTPFAEEIRKVFKTTLTHNDAPLPLTELFLVMASRVQHFEKLIKQETKVVLSDRFLDSSYVFQGGLGKVDKKFIDSIAHQFLGDFVPTLTFVFVSTASENVQRIKNRNIEAGDRLDALKDEDHAVINNCFRELVENNVPYPGGKVPERVLIEAVGTIEEIHELIKLATFKKLGIL